jgi:hypothetical protein
MKFNIEEKTTTSVSKSFIFHDIEGDRVDLDKNKALLKEKLEAVKDKKMLNALSKLENPNENKQKRAADDIILWAIDNDQALLQPVKYIKVFYQDLPYKKLENLAARYFIERFELSVPKQLSFLEKKGGVQLGRRLIVTHNDGKKVTYHVKTHREGLKSGHSASAKPVDLKELMVYKILELSGLGIETHFFCDNENDFYIATKDAGYDDKSQQQREFLTYKQIKAKQPSVDLLQDPTLVNGFIKTDIVSRLLSLSVIINNPDNIGVIPQFKVIDFAPPTTKEYRNTTIFKDWLSGNNQYNYSDETVVAILKNKESQQKIKDSLAALKELEGFDVVVEQAYTDLVETGVYKVFTSPEILLEDLQRYMSAIIENYSYLQNGIEDALKTTKEI